MNPLEDADSLPTWLEYVKAIGPPFVALVAACIAGFYARRQAQIAKDKLKLDLFKDRLEVFTATMAVCTKSAMTEDGALTPAEIDAFYASYFKAKFLFEGEILDFLDEIYEVLRGLGHLDEQIATTRARLGSLDEYDERGRREATVFITEKRAEKRRRRIKLLDQKGRCQKLFQGYMSYGHWR